MRPEGGRPRRRVKDPLPPEELQLLALGEAIRAKRTHLEVRKQWIDEGPDASCQFCDRRILHTRELHYALLDARVRRLPRGRQSKVRLAERAYRKATGLKWDMEKALWHEVVTERRTVRELAPILGVSFATVARWCRALGIQDPDGLGASKHKEYNEYEE